MTRCAVYIRKSREEQGKPSHRLTVQREQLPAHARAQGWSVEIYDDGHASAARGKAADLSERSRLEADIRAGRVDVILCIELSRLSRDDSLQDYVGWLHLCSEHRVKLATLSRILDPAQHSDWMLLLMEGGFSSVEMRVLQARMREGRRQAWLEGKYLAGNPPMPYRYDKGAGGLVVDEAQLPKFRELMQLAETSSARQIAEQTGTPVITVRRAIADERLLMYRGLRIDRETGEEIAGQWPAVIDADQAQRIRANRRAGHRSPRRSITGLLNGLGIYLCGYCNRAVRTWSPGKARKDGTLVTYYGCGHLGHLGATCTGRRVPQHIADHLVVTNLLGTLSNIERSKEHWIANQQEESNAQQIETIAAEIAALQTKKQRLVAAITEGIITFADAKDQRHQIDDALGDCRRRRDTLTATITEPPRWDELDIDGADWDLLDIEERREILKLALESIRMTRSRLILTYRFPRNPDGTRTAEIKLPPPGIGSRRIHWKLPKK